MKNLKKIVSILLTLAIMASMFSIVLARPDFKPNDSAIDGKANGIANTILGIVQWIGYAIAVAMVIYVGIKYVTSSANEKADLKKGSVNLVIGAIVIAAASTLAGILFDVGESLK